MSPFTARDKNLVDKLESYQDFMARLGITDKNISDIYDYYDNNVKDTEIKGKNGTIAVIYAEGSIVYEDNGTQKNIISPNNISEKISKALEIKNLRGIVLRVNSGGGSALASEIIYQQFSKVNVPIYVSMGDTAASGGYYISMVGSKVFADKATITGSIGVVSMIPKLYNSQNKFGVTSNSISKGKYADINDSFTPLSEESKAKISASMNETYNEFKSRVIKNRKINDDKLEEYAQGRIWLGDEAKNIRLVDDIASLDEVIKRMANDLNLGDSYGVSDIFVEEDFSQKLKALSAFVLEKFNIKSQIKETIPESEKVFEDYELATKNVNKPLYYLPYSLKMY
jgi:signal peptide peptidase sppA, 36K type